MWIALTSSYRHDGGHRRKAGTMAARMGPRGNCTRILGDGDRNHRPVL